MDREKNHSEYLKQLLDRAYRSSSMQRDEITEDEELTDDELEFVAQELQNPTSGESRLLLMDIIDYAGGRSSTKYKQVLEQFLDGPYTLYASQALSILCGWGYTEDYVPRLIEFIQGARWDPDNRLRYDALSIAQEYLITHSNSDLRNVIEQLCKDSDTNSGVKTVACNVIYSLDYNRYL